MLASHEFMCGDRLCELALAAGLVRREPFGRGLGRRCEVDCLLHVNFQVLPTPAVTYVTEKACNLLCYAVLPGPIAGTSLSVATSRQPNGRATPARSQCSQSGAALQ